MVDAWAYEALLKMCDLNGGGTIALLATRGAAVSTNVEISSWPSIAASSFSFSFDDLCFAAFAADFSSSCFFSSSSFTYSG